jgi:hypothetical protein
MIVPAKMGNIRSGVELNGKPIVRASFMVVRTTSSQARGNSGTHNGVPVKYVMLEVTLRLGQGALLRLS